MFDESSIIDAGAVDVAAILRGLCDVAKVALGPDQPPPTEAETIALANALLTTIERVMPEDLQRKDPRVLDGQLLRKLL